MSCLYLLRHAKSSWDDPSLADHERPLSARGRRDAQRIAAYLLQAGIAPALVLCSTAARTRETLELVRPALGDDVAVKLEAGLYGASASSLLERLHAVPEEAQSVLLIGHNPGLQELALLLTGAGDERERIEAKFPTGALATLTVPAAWKTLAPHEAVLAGYVVPKQLA